MIEDVSSQPKPSTSSAASAADSGQWEAVAFEPRYQPMSKSQYQWPATASPTASAYPVQSAWDSAQAAATQSLQLQFQELQRVLEQRIAQHAVPTPVLEPAPQSKDSCKQPLLSASSSSTVAIMPAASSVPALSEIVSAFSQVQAIRNQARQSNGQSQSASSTLSPTAPVFNMPSAASSLSVPSPKRYSLSEMDATEAATEDFEPDDEAAYDAQFDEQFTPRLVPLEETESYPWWPAAMPSEPVLSAAPAYHTNTQLPNEIGLVVDTAAIGNLQGEIFARKLASAAKRHGHNSVETRRSNALHVQGVGNGSQTCEFNAAIPIALAREDGSITLETYEAPVVPQSSIPGLLGLDSLTAKRAIINTFTNELILCGPGGCVLSPSPGSERFQLKRAPSGHLLLPVSEYQRITAKKPGSSCPSIALLAGPFHASASNAQN